MSYADQLRISLIQNNMRAEKDNYDTLIITLNRADDPYTPLITPWNYESMIYEHTNCRDN